MSGSVRGEPYSPRAPPARADLEPSNPTAGSFALQAAFAEGFEMLFPPSPSRGKGCGARCLVVSPPGMIWGGFVSPAVLWFGTTEPHVEEARTEGSHLAPLRGWEQGSKQFGLPLHCWCQEKCLLSSFCSPYHAWSTQMPDTEQGSERVVFSLGEG